MFPTISIDNKLTRVDVGESTLWFSYETLVAFTVRGETVVRKNVWGTTTGKHLNQIDNNQETRVNEEEFKKKYNELTRGIRLR